MIGFLDEQYADSLDVDSGRRTVGLRQCNI